MPTHSWNERSSLLIEDFLEGPYADSLRVTSPGGAEVLDFSEGGLEAGLLLARACLADLAHIELQLPRPEAHWPYPSLLVRADRPYQPCLCSQYAGRKVAVNDFFAMGSGPFRLLWPGEEMFADWLEPSIEKTNASEAVGVLETSQPVTEEVVHHISNELDMRPDQMTLLTAPTASLPGVMQVVARGLETALHKLHELEYDVRSIRSGVARVPMPPVPKNDLRGIGLTNDAVLYGAQVFLWVDDPKTDWKTLGPQIPASSSKDYGEPFYDVFQKYDGDFYKIDPMLFSPAKVTIYDQSSGKVHTFGQLNHEVLMRSFSQSEE